MRTRFYDNRSRSRVFAFSYSYSYETDEGDSIGMSFLVFGYFNVRTSLPDLPYCVHLLLDRHTHTDTGAHVENCHRLVRMRM